MSLKQQKQQEPQFLQKTSGGTIGTVTESDMDETDWFDTCTNHHVIASSYQSMVEDPWNHPLLDEDDYFIEASKRVSLDVTETWMTTDDHDATASDLWLDPNLMLSPSAMAMAAPVFSFALPSSISFPTDDDDDHDDTDHADSMLHLLTSTASLGGDDSSSSNNTTDYVSETESWHSQFQQRRAQLAKSMAASQSTRSLLSQHVQTRASLQKVLLEIEKSTTQIQRHIVIESVGMAAGEGGVESESTAIHTAATNTSTLPVTAEETEEELDMTAAATTSTTAVREDEDVEMEDAVVPNTAPSAIVALTASQPNQLKPVPSTSSSTQA